MRDEDYVNNLMVSNLCVENVSHFAEIAENVFDKVDMKLHNTSADVMEIRKVKKTRVYESQPIKHKNGNPLLMVLGYRFL